ncbi:MAG TPA: hypothetical protein RMH99_21710 [Sandaracinaceae bacterium LLY-WYZ-13_1]|nr:hypothetical protein [Sandaracinaceae bacterium LLY-WYZ-13_1]
MLAVACLAPGTAEAQKAEAAAKSPAIATTRPTQRRRPRHDRDVRRVDQDCDAAIDEGLMTLLGSPISIVEDLGCSNGASANLVAHRDGVTVVYKRDDEDDVRASFFGRDGVALATDVTVRSGVAARGVYAARFSSSGDVEQVVLAWRETDAIPGEVFETSGGTGRDSDIEGVRMFSLGDRLLVGWEEVDDRLQLATVEPTIGFVSPALELPVSTHGDIDAGEFSGGGVGPDEASAPRCRRLRCQYRDTGRAPHRDARGARRPARVAARDEHAGHPTP